ncbi:hypothetical protein [Tenacibaculum finnmarkense]|uniref:hypothetical protein n=1 Tax=Tenacibaculum finnmarkense TaxID=2781243 RepID=UPI001E332084|nr:hypothetical protein [Tenacibaculum finnmarkense]MCD8403900.1 hypothetical protein [Tenacibaculum finnmarkense genomovar finnmarkense]
MSHSSGALKFKDGTIKYYEYDGTSDIVLSFHYDTLKEVGDNWRSGKHIDCSCGKEEPVSIYSDYGGGFYIDGVACKKCKSVKSNEFDFDIIEKEDTNHWADFF